jgi:hypothetical protein
MGATISMVLLALGDNRKPQELPLVKYLTDELLQKQNDDGGWGYEFDVSLRWGSYTKNESNLVATYFAVEALSAHGLTGSWQQGATDFLMARFKKGYFTYANQDDPLIHNANYLGALALSTLNGSKDVVLEAIDYSNALQNLDGSWPYGVGEKLGWVDNFHTIYNLRALIKLNQIHSTLTPVIYRGVDYWLSEMFIGDLPKYYSSDKESSEDLNTHANTLLLLLELSQIRRYKQTLETKLKAVHTFIVNATTRADRATDSFRWRNAPVSWSLSKYENWEKRE